MCTKRGLPPFKKIPTKIALGFWCTWWWAVYIPTENKLSPFDLKVADTEGFISVLIFQCILHSLVQSLQDIISCYYEETQSLEEEHGIGNHLLKWRKLLTSNWNTLFHLSFFITYSYKVFIQKMTSGHYVSVHWGPQGSYSTSQLVLTHLFSPIPKAMLLQQNDSSSFHRVCTTME